MKRTHAPTSALGAAALFAAGLALVVLPAPISAQQVEVGVYSNTVVFQPTVDHRGGTLLVSGGGTEFSQRFESGDEPWIGMYDPDGQLLADGTYTWTLELLPDMATARKLRIAAIVGEGAEPWEAQTGVFTIQDGEIADTGVGETRPERQPSRLAGGSAIEQAFTRQLAPTGRAAQDGDDAVGSQPDAEARINAAISRSPSAPAFAAGGLQLDRTAGEREDATALALGQSLEHAMVRTDKQQMQSQRVPRGRQAKPADGANGRLREDQ